MGSLTRAAVASGCFVPGFVWGRGGSLLIGGRGGLLVCGFVRLIGSLGYFFFEGGYGDEKSIVSEVMG